MNTHDSYEEVMKDVQEINEFLELSLDKDEYHAYNGDFKFEYAHESITEKHSPYKKRISHV